MAVGSASAIATISARSAVSAATSASTSASRRRRSCSAGSQGQVPVSRTARRHADVGQAQAQPLGAPDEPEPVDRGLGVLAVAGGGAVGCRQQAGSPVVADGVGRHVDRGGQLRDSQSPRGCGRHAAGR